MNARQAKKRLKREVTILKRDNDLMRRIITDNPAMQELYDLYNRPLKVIHEHHKHYRIKQAMDSREIAYAQNSSMLRTHVENSILRELRPVVWDNLKTEKDIYSDKWIYSLDIWI